MAVQRQRRCAGSYLRGIVPEVAAKGEIAVFTVYCTICRRPFRRSARGIAPQTTPPHKPGWRG